LLQNGKDFKAFLEKINENKKAIYKPGAFVYNQVL